jgi:diguanylate cyclase (GGDEF)-like protein
MAKNIENAKRRILAVDDDPDSLSLVTKALEWEGYKVESAHSGEEALRKITKWEPNLVLLDVNMPGINGLQTLEFLRGSPDYISTIFVSGSSNTEDVVKGLDAGADDYICKPYNPIELLSRVRCQLRIKDIRDELKKANAKLKELVEIDDLTGLFNMRSLYDRLDHELQRAARYNRAVAVIMMDMDHFKSANDENDHLFGSFVLAQVGKIIRNNIRRVDFGARYGGDEFLITLCEINYENACVFAERLRKVIEEHVFQNDKHTKKLTASIGMAVTPVGRSLVDARTLVREADRALYTAKEKGRNCVHTVNLAENPTYLRAPHDNVVKMRKSRK